MTTWVVEARIEAPAEQVFDVFANPARIPDVHSDRQVKFQSKKKTGVGTKFTAIRMMNGKPSETPLEITELEAPRKVRMVGDQGGATWDTVVRVEPDGQACRVTTEMVAIPFKFMPRLMIPLIKGMIRKAMQADLDDAKAYCEASL